MTLLHIACCEGHVEVVSTLLAAGAPLEAHDMVLCHSSKMVRLSLIVCLQSGMTPLHRACLKGRVEVVPVLLAAGAKIEAIDKV
jgi:ankyrin repeat protein